MMKQYFDINDFFKKYYFHDSLVKNILYDGSKLVIDIELCYWKQSEYNAYDEEIRDIKLIFENVLNFNFESENNKIDNDIILKFSIVENEKNNGISLIEAVLEGGKDIKIIKFRTDSVTLCFDCI
ncbi:hypothetical protein [Tepidibacter aestuarii]|uniref:hypothetical protein n=1 Tax=Tepidibacter aestuarii TaxID=2925782 RepID=UPI0020BFB363|nr:hypothetical protein [Tepidibacter aestuarii]CAH2213574.1 conserved protein of unknown function [Tepidibacter aestuarii]